MSRIRPGSSLADPMLKPRQPLRPQRVEKVSVMPTELPTGKFDPKKYTPQQIAKMQQESRARFKKILEEQKRQLAEQRQKQLLSPQQAKEFTNQQKEAIRKFNKSRQQQAVISPEKMKKQRDLFQQFQKGKITVKDLRSSGVFRPQDIKNIRQGSLVQRFNKGDITARELSRSGLFSIRQLRDITRNVRDRQRFQKMSPEERRAFIERRQQQDLRRQQRLLRRQRPDFLESVRRRRRQVRRAFRRSREGDRETMITYPTSGRRRRVSPTQTQRRRRVSPIQRRRRGMRVPI